jgi:hypothetical protein
MVDEDDANLASVAGVYGARRVENGDATFERETASRTHLSLEAFWEFQKKACGH